MELPQSICPQKRARTGIRIGLIDPRLLVVDVMQPWRALVYQRPIDMLGDGANSPP